MRHDFTHLTNFRYEEIWSTPTGREWCAGHWQGSAAVWCGSSSTPATQSPSGTASSSSWTIAKSVSPIYLPATSATTLPASSSSSSAFSWAPWMSGKPAPTLRHFPWPGPPRPPSSTSSTPSPPSIRLPTTDTSRKRKSGASWSSATYTSATRVARTCQFLTASASTSIRDKLWPWWDHPGAASPRLSNSSNASTIRTAVPSNWRIWPERPERGVAPRPHRNRRARARSLRVHHQGKHSIRAFRRLRHPNRQGVQRRQCFWFIQKLPKVNNQM